MSNITVYIDTVNETIVALTTMTTVNDTSDDDGLLTATPTLGDTYYFHKVSSTTT